jgi:hypothetical protein
MDKILKCASQQNVKYLSKETQVDLKSKKPFQFQQKISFFPPIKA